MKEQIDKTIYLKPHNKDQLAKMWDYLLTINFIACCTIPLIKSVTWWQRLLQFFSLFLICDDQGVQISAATHLELYIVFILLDLNSYCIKIPGLSLCIDYTKEQTA